MLPQTWQTNEYFKHDPPLHEIILAPFFHYWFWSISPHSELAILFDAFHSIQHIILKSLFSVWMAILTLHQEQHVYVNVGLLPPSALGWFHF